MSHQPANEQFETATTRGLRESLPPIQGKYLALAGPGTGKTALLVERAKQILAEAGKSRIKLLALTFTNKAAAEMKNRLASAVPDIDERAFIGTFHSFGSHVLRSHGNVIGIPSEFVIFNEDDQLEVLHQLQQEDRVPAGLDLESIVRAFSRLKSRGLLAEEGTEEGESISESLRTLYLEYRNALRASNALDFGDLVLETVRLFRESPQVLRLYRIAYKNILVDEFQDTTPAQYALLRLLADEDSTNLLAVADEDQLIFEWNEARLETLNRFLDDFGAKVIYSHLTHRCPPNIVEAANAVIRNNRLRFPGKPEVRSQPAATVVQPIRLYVASDENDEAEFVAETIVKLRTLDHGPSDFAVIARARRLLDPTDRKLESSQIPAERPSLAGLGGTEESEIVLRLLRWLQNSRDEQSARRVVRFFAPEDVDNFEQAVTDAKRRAIPFEAALVEVEERGSAVVQRLVQRVAQWRPWARDTRTLLEKLSADLPSFLKSSDGREEAAEEIQRTLSELLDLCKTMSARGRLALPDFLLSLPQVVSRDRLGVPAGRDGVVSLLTIHQAKGLEFPVVFLIGLESGTFPDFRSERDSRHLEEERRLFYVGITRTKMRLYLSYCEQRRSTYGKVWPKQPSRFIGEIPAALVERVSAEGEVG